MTRGRELGVAAAAWCIAALSVATMLAQGWVPIDDGTIGLSARYVAAGYLPHRDFAYPYTGGLAFWNALAVGIFGDTQLAPRYALYVAFLLWLPAIWWIARRFVGPWLSAAAMLLAAWWSLLVYPAAMPTWYLLFFSTWIAVALSRWSDDGRDAWLVCAGALAGLAIITKQTGLATLAGAGLGVLALHRGAGGAPRWVTLALLAVAAVVPVAIVVLRGPLAGEVLTAALPLAAVLAVLAMRATGTPMRAWLLLALGAAFPLVVFTGWYAAHGALGALGEGLVGGSLRTASTINQPMAGAPALVQSALPVIVLTLGVGLGTHWLVARGANGRIAAALLVAGAAAASLLAAMQFTWAYLAIWNAATLVGPVAIGAAAWLSRPRAEPQLPPLALALAAMVAVQALNLVPYAAPNYHAYVAPIGFLLALVVTGRVPRAWVVFPIVLLIAFGGWFHRIGNVGTVGRAPIWWDDAHTMPGAHGGLRVTAADSANWSRLVALTAEHGGADAFVAGPELNALYYLAGTRRVVAQPYLVAPDRHADSAGVAAAIDTTAVRAVVINHAPIFLPRASASALSWMRQQYPNVERVGEVEFRWR